MSNYRAILKQLIDAGIDPDSAAQAALLITSGFVEPTAANLRNGWTNQLAERFIKVYQAEGSEAALQALDKAIIR